MRPIAIIQARMGSTRLPGKVLMDLCGRPVIWHIIERLKRAKNIDEIVVATTNNRNDDKLTEYLKGIGVNVFRGSEDDVLDRFIRAAERFKADIVVRICSDSPLIEPAEIDKCVAAMIRDKADYVMTEAGIKCLHEGFEAVSLEALKKQLGFSHEKWVKEHVTLFIRENPESFRITHWVPDDAFQKEGFRMSMDEESDLLFMRKIYEKLYKEGDIVDLKDAIRLLENNPEIRNMNAGVKRKDPKA